MEPQQWVSMAERQPEPGQWVIAYTDEPWLDGERLHRTIQACFEPWGWVQLGAVPMGKDSVIYWHPLPLPPRTPAAKEAKLCDIA